MTLAIVLCIRLVGLVSLVCAMAVEWDNPAAAPTWSIIGFVNILLADMILWGAVKEFVNASKREDSE